MKEYLDSSVLIEDFLKEKKIPKRFKMFKEFCASVMLDCCPEKFEVVDERKFIVDEIEVTPKNITSDKVTQVIGYFYSSIEMKVKAKEVFDSNLLGIMRQLE